MHLHKWSFCIVALCCVGVAARNVALSSFDDSNPGEFVFRGYQTLGHALLPDSFRTNYYNDTECLVFCNGEEMTGDKCIGRTTIECLSVLKLDTRDESRVDLYTRTCEGKFVNQTIESWETFDTSQACRGVTIMTMRSEHKDPDQTEWETDFSYRKLCSTRFLMTIETRVDPKGRKPDVTEVATLCEGSSGTYIDTKSKTNAKEKGPKEPKDTAKCNGKKTDWDTPCVGLFEAVEWVGDAECTTICVGQWLPYYINWECEGEYKFTRYDTSNEGFNNRIRTCSGSAVISGAEYVIGYQMCNGESRYDESYTDRYGTVA